MSTMKKRFTVGWAAGIVLGIACGAFAGSVGNTFSTGDTLTATQMNGIAGAVNDNNTRLGTAETAISNLKSSSGTCATNNASDEMVRVGPLCVDKNKASLWNGTGAAASPVASTAGCNSDGTGAGCAGIVAQSRSAATAVDGNTISWAQAQRACANAGKRLLTAGEWMAAFSSGLTSDISTLDKLEYVDGFGPSNGSTLAQAGYMGRTTAAGGVAMVANIGYNEIGDLGGTPYNGDFLNFRCAR